MPNKTVQISAEFVGLQSSLERQIDASMRKMGNNFKIPFNSQSLGDFNNQLDRATQRVITLGTAFTVLTTASQSIRSLVAATVEVEKSLTSVNTIFRLTNENLNRFSGNLFDIARDTATAFTEVTKAATEFARQGLSVAETQKAVSAALMLSRDAGIDVAESVRALTSATNSFNKEALNRIQIANRLASVDAAFAVSSKDLAEALIRTGSAAADAGVNFNQFIGLVTSAQQISQRGGTVIAGALNTIFTRLGRTDTLEALDSLGIAITDVRGQALPTIQVLQNFAQAYDKMGGSVKNQAAELVGGVRQLNTLKATLKDLSQGDSSVFMQVQQVIARNSNELERRNAERNKTLSAMGSQISTTGQQIGSNFGNVGLSNTIKPLLGGLLNNPITDALKDANGNAETMGGQIAEKVIKGFASSLVYGLGPVLMKVLYSITAQVSGNLMRDVTAIANLNTVEKQRAALEKEIAETYKIGGAELQKQLATMTSMSERAALIGASMAHINAGRVAESNEISATAAAMSPRTYGWRVMRKVPRSAEGYIPMSEESQAISMGVGGAPSSARPVYLPSFNRGGGQFGIVANTSEFKVPTAAGGAIFNREMIQKYGLPPGSTPVAAGGYVPHAADGSLRSAAEIALGTGTNAPATAYQAALRRSNTQGFPASNFPPFPNLNPDFSIGMWESEKEKASESMKLADQKGALHKELAKQFEVAQREILASEKKQAALAKAREKMMEDSFTQMAAMDKEENSYKRRKVSITQAELNLTERAVNEYQAVLAEQRLMATLTFNEQKQVQKQVAALQKPPFVGTHAPIPPLTDESIPETNERSILRVKNMRDAERLEREFYGNIEARKRNKALSGNAILSNVAYQTERADVNRQVVMNSAQQQLSAGVGLNNLGQSERAVIINQIRRQVIKELGFGDNIPGALANPASRFQIQMATANKMASMNVSPPPPPPPPIPPILPVRTPLLSRMARSPMASFALGMGLPMIGGMMDDGESGTTSGMVRGGLKSGLQFGGTGAMIGSMAGPLGTGVGLGLGATIGALVGSISKSIKTFDELSAEIDQKTKKMSEELSGANEVFRLTEDLKDAIASNNQEQVRDLKKQRAIAIAKTTNPKYVDIFKKFGANTEQGSVEMAREGNQEMMAHLLSTDLTRAMARESMMGPGQNMGVMLGGALGLPFGKSVASLTSSFGAYLGKKVDSDPLSKDARQEGKQAMMAALSPMSKEGLLQLRHQAQTSPSDAIRVVGTQAGFNEKQIAGLVEQAKGKKSTESLVMLSLFNAITDLLLNESNDIKALEAGAIQDRGLIQRAATLRHEADIISTSGAGNQQIRQTRQQLALTNPALTNLNQLGLQGIYASQNIRENANIQAAVLGKEGLANLTDIGRTQQLSPEAINALKDTQPSLEGFKSLLDEITDPSKKTALSSFGLGSNKSPFKVELEKLINALEKNVLSANANTWANDETNRLLREQLAEQMDARGAQKEITGAFNKTRDELGTAIKRKDPLEVINQRASASRMADLNAMRFQGLLTDKQYGARVLNEQSDVSYGQNLASYGYQQERGSKRRVSDLVRSGNLSLLDRIQYAQDSLASSKQLGEPEDLQQGQALEVYRLKAQQRVGMRLGYSQDQSRLDISNFASNQAIAKLESEMRLNKSQNAPEQLQQSQALELYRLKAQRQVTMGSGTEGQARLATSAFASRQAREGTFTTGSDVTAAGQNYAMEKGLQGQAQGSFLTSFGSAFAGFKKDIKQFGEVGKQVADSLASSFSGAFGDFVTGAKSAKDAFRSFVTGVLADSARAFATKAVVSLLGMFLGNIGTTSAGNVPNSQSIYGTGAGASATGGPIKRASGGSIPTMLMGGEYVYPPVQAKRMGGRMLNALNTGTMRAFAPGGLVRGGSGVKDDVFQPLAEGSYVIRKSMVERYGANNLASLSIGGYPDITGSASSAMRFAEGGPVASMMATPSPVSVSSGSGGGVFNIGVTINDNTTTSSSSGQGQQGSGWGDQNFGLLLASRMKQVALQTIEEQKRMGGMLRPQSNLRSS